MSLLTMELKKLGFYCGIELEVYLLDTGKCTSLVIEATDKRDDVLYRYDFYKQVWYPHSASQFTVYGENLSAPALLKRVKQYLSNREKYLAKLKK